MTLDEIILNHVIDNCSEEAGNEIVTFIKLGYRFDYTGTENHKDGFKTISFTAHKFTCNETFKITIQATIKE